MELFRFGCVASSANRADCSGETRSEQQHRRWFRDFTIAAATFAEEEAFVAP